MRHLYLAATGQNRGKTTTSLGLMDLFLGRGLRTGFCKPVGQRTVIEDGVSADEDAVLMREVFGLPEPFPVMSPVHIPRGFTRSYIAGEVVEDLGERIRRAHDAYRDHDVLLLEGTGHAGVGAVIGLSNARVAALLGAPAIIVSGGGIGRPIDEIVLNAALFAAHGVRVAGAIVNKVFLDEAPGLARTLERGLARHGIPLLGVLPYRPILSSPTLGMVLEGTRARLVQPGPSLDLVVDAIAVGAMEPRHMLERLTPGTLVIVPGDREDALLTLAGAHLAGRPRAALVEALVDEVPGAVEAGPDRRALGIILTGGYEPRPEVMDAIRAAGLFAATVADETYEVASDIHDLLVKTHAADAQKIAEIKALVAEWIDVDRILEAAAEA